MHYSTARIDLIENEAQYKLTPGGKVQTVLT